MIPAGNRIEREVALVGSHTLNTPLSPPVARTWRAGQVTAVLVTAVVLAGLMQWPTETLTVVWYAVVPLLPASFLVNAGLWRGVCPIASANTMWPTEPRKAMTERTQAVARVVGMVALVLLIPLRHLLLNQNGPVLAAVLVLLVAVAGVLGWAFRTKSGFCNSFCPILPVEKLYGQSPLVWIQNPRCVPCNSCSLKGCLDIRAPRAVMDGGRPPSARSWLRSPFGVFAAGFPGVVLGYFLAAGETEWLRVYGITLGTGAAGLVLFWALAYAVDASARLTAMVFAALAIAVYYWFAVPTSVEMLALPAWTGPVLLVAMAALITYWFLRGVWTRARI